MTKDTKISEEINKLKTNLEKNRRDRKKSK